MKKIFRFTANLIITTIALSLLASCEHKDLCYQHPHSTKVRIDVDWSQFTKDTPTGMSVAVYDSEGNEVTTALSNTLSHVYVTLPAGKYHSIAFNQSPSEYGTVLFNNMDSYYTAQVVTAKYKSRWYESRRGETDEVAEEPEWIGADRLEGMTVTDDMIQSGVEHSSVRAEDNEHVIGTHVPHNLIHTLNVKVNMSGIKNLRSARASLDGLAEGYIFSVEQPTEASVTQLLESWKLSTDPKSARDAKGNPTDGYIHTQITFFGLPSGHSRAASDNYFFLSLLLTDNETQIDLPFYVGDLITKDPSLENTWNLELTCDEPLPDVTPSGSSETGFSATVDDWEDGESVNIGL